MLNLDVISLRKTTYISESADVVHGKRSFQLTSGGDDGAWLKKPCNYLRKLENLTNEH